MKRAAEVKPSVRCAVSITKLEEPEAADGNTRCSPKPLASDGAGIAKKRARKPEKSSKEKGSEEKSRRSKKKRVEVVRDTSMEKIMAKLADLDKRRTEEKSKISNLEKRIEKIASKVEEEQVAGDGMKKEKRTKKPEDNTVMMMKKKKVVTWRLSQELLDYLRTKEVMGLLATEAPLQLWASKMGRALFDFNPTLKEDIAAEFQENREFDAHVLYQYRTIGYVEIQEEVSDEEEGDG